MCKPELFALEHISAATFRFEWNLSMVYYKLIQKQGMLSDFLNKNPYHFWEQTSKMRNENFLKIIITPDLLIYLKMYICTLFK